MGSTVCIDTCRRGTNWKTWAWRCRRFLSSADPRLQSRLWSQSLHPERATEERNTTWDSSTHIISSQQHNEAAAELSRASLHFRSVQSINCMNLFYFIHSGVFIILDVRCGDSRWRWVVGKPGKQLLMWAKLCWQQRENITQTTDRLMEPTQHRNPLNYYYSHFTQSLEEVKFNIGRQDNQQIVCNYLLTLATLYIHKHTGGAGEWIQTLKYWHICVSTHKTRTRYTSSHHTLSSYLQWTANYIVKSLQALPVLRLLLSKAVCGRETQHQQSNRAATHAGGKASQWPLEVRDVTAVISHSILLLLTSDRNKFLRHFRC